MQTQKVYGPPGTGKTYYLLGKFEEELKKHDPSRVAFLTFTRAGRLEALGRASLPEDELPWVKTLHAICYNLLKVRRDQLLQPAHIKAFGKSIGVNLSGRMYDPMSLEQLSEQNTQQTKADRLLQLNHLGRHRGMSLKEALKDAPQELDLAYSKWFTESYRKWKTAEGLLDYTDLLSEYLARGPVLELDTLFVDEAQDLSYLQWQVVRKLSSGVSQRYLAGDDDQAIFIWAGASAELFNTEPADEVVVLPQSYRIPRAVHDVANKIIRRIKVRQQKEYLPRGVDGEYRPVGFLDPKLLRGSSLVLYRNYHRGFALVQELEQYGIPFTGSLSALGNQEVREALSGWYKTTQGKPITTGEAKAIIQYCQPAYLQEGAKARAGMRSGEISTTSFFKVEALKADWHHVMPRLPRLRYLGRAIAAFGFEAVMKPQVQLMSIHQCKGREAETVVLDLEMARRTHERYLQEPDEEHRVYYVAVTRAKERLYTLMPNDSAAYVL